MDDYHRPSRRVYRFEKTNSILKKIEDEIAGGNYFYAFLLEISTIEDFLSSIIMLSREAEEDPPEEIDFAVDKMGFYNLLILNTALGNFDGVLFAKLNSFRKDRNKYVHDLTGSIFENPKSDKKFIKITLFGLELCQELFHIQDLKVDSKAPSEQE